MTYLHVTIANAIWNTISLVFLIYGVRALSIFVRALRAARNERRLYGTRRLIAIDLARDYVIGEALRVAGHALSLLLGLESLFVPSLPHGAPLDRIHTFYSDEAVIVFIALNVLSGANSIRAVRSWKRRHNIMRGGAEKGVERRRSVVRSKEG